MGTLENRVKERLGALITVKEAAAAANLSKSKIYQLIDQGVLRRVRLPACNKVLIHEDEIRRYIELGVKAGVTSQDAAMGRSG